MLFVNKMLVNFKKHLTKDINQHIIAIYQQKQQEQERKDEVNLWQEEKH